MKTNPAGSIVSRTRDGEYWSGNVCNMNICRDATGDVSCVIQEAFVPVMMNSIM